MQNLSIEQARSQSEEAKLDRTYFWGKNLAAKFLWQNNIRNTLL